MTKREQPLRLIRARPAKLLYTDVTGNTRWRLLSLTGFDWVDDKNEVRGEPDYVLRMWDHDQYKMVSIVPERIHKWEQQN